MSASTNVNMIRKDPFCVSGSNDYIRLGHKTTFSIFESKSVGVVFLKNKDRFASATTLPVELLIT